MCLIIKRKKIMARSEKPRRGRFGMSSWFRSFFLGGSGERARNKKGHYIKDDPDTTDVNEAYVDGLTPANRKRRSRGPKGKFKADDKSTKRRNEAYKGGIAPPKTRKKKKIKGHTNKKPRVGSNRSH